MLKEVSKSLLNISLSSSTCVADDDDEGATHAFFCARPLLASKELPLVAFLLLKSASPSGLFPCEGVEAEAEAEAKAEASLREGNVGAIFFTAT